MKNNYNMYWWLIEQDIPAAAGQPDPAGMQAPMGNPMGDQPQSPDPGGYDPNIANMPDQMGGQPQDISSDPQAPDMPEPKPHADDFEVWKRNYMKESIKGDSNKLLDMLNQIRDNDAASPYHRKFVEDNWNIQLLRQNSNIEKASKEVRKLIKDQLDRNNPATSVVNHLSAVLSTVPTLNNIFIKLAGYSGLKGDLHRKYIAALLGCIQVGSGAGTEDLIYNEKDYSILISTRYNSRWGDVMLGNWQLKESDPEKYLASAELKRLEDGSPEEKDVLRKRIIMESISDQFEKRAFIIHVIGDDGTLYTLGWDLASSLQAAYTDGKLVIKTKHTDNAEVMIDEEGNMIPLLNISISYLKETGSQDENGFPEIEELNFIERRDGMLFLNADMRTIKEAAKILPGSVFKETPYNGNPSDLKTLVRCVYSAADMLLRNC